MTSLTPYSVSPALLAHKATLKAGSVFAFCSAAVALLMPPAMAQEAIALEEIVVTAQKRSENLQDVPIAISAFSGEALAIRNINTVQGIGNLTPGVNFDAGSPFSGSSGVLTAYIRGIGQDDFAFNLDPGVGVYLDGVYLARTVGANADLLDVDRIEVLKGPQGTLFGRNSIGGAISIVTREPGEEFAFRSELITGRYERFDVRGTADIPILKDKLLSTVTFSRTSRDGYLERVPFPGSENFATENIAAFPNAGLDTPSREGDENQWSIRTKILWRASDTVKVTFAGDYQNVDQAGLANVLLDTFALEGNPAELFGTAYNLCISTPNELLPADAGGNIAALCGPLGGTGESLAEVNIDDNPNNDRLPFDDRFVTDDIDQSFATGPSFSKLEQWGLSGTVEWDVGFGEVKSITAYRELAWRAATDADGSPTIANHAAFVMNQQQFSQELQVAGRAFSERLDYVVGAYYFQEEGNLNDFVPIGTGLLQIDGNNVFDTSTWAVFTHLNYKFTDRISLTFGARYTEENKEFEGFQRDANGFLYKLVAGAQLQDVNDELRVALGFPDANDPLRFYPPGVQELDFSDFAPRAGIEFQVTDNALLYASYSKGYKSGGWTTRLSAPLPEAPTFNEETADSYEIGVKSQLFDNRLRFNAAAFFTDYSGIQLNQVQGISPTVRNAGNAELYGFELDWDAIVTDSLRLTGSMSYIHDEYTFIAPGVNAGDRLPKTPRWKVNLSPIYETDLPNGGAFRAVADYTFTSSVENNTENTALLQRPSVHMLNATFTYVEPQERYEISVGGTNLLNERFLVSGFLQEGGGLTYGNFSRPIEWLAKLAVRF
jgi:iron complex outermembrane receptor protein